MAGSFTGRDDAPACLVWADGAPSAARTGPDRPLLFVHGPPAELLAWLLGRGSGAGLQVSGGARAAAGPWR